ncbi:MAG: redoxin domain-containing protein, partial [Chloroflexota bacterium]
MLNPDQKRKLIIGEPAPNFTLHDLQGQSHQLQDYQENIVVLNFWSATCQWAERADKEIIPMLADWGNEVVYLSIASNANEPYKQLSEVSQARKIPLVLHDANQEIAKLYHAEYTPEIFILDHKGLLQYQGAFDDVTFRNREPSVNYLQEALASVRAGRTPDP